MVRLMLHACDLDIEGLIASSNMNKGRLVHDDHIRTIVGAYGRVRDPLAQHRSDFPTAEYLLERIAGDANRPSLSDAESFEEIMARRDPFYRRAAHFVIECGTRKKRDLAEEILERFLRECGLD